jgi:photosystem II stability/assembly factor-like uncharacterized protein
MQKSSGGVAGVWRVALMALLPLALASCWNDDDDPPPAGPDVSAAVCSAGAGQGWCWQRPLPQGNAIHAYDFVDDQNGWAVGDLGTVMATTDGGRSWKKQPTGTGLALGYVDFVDARVGWALTDVDVVLKTADGGASWSRPNFVHTGIVNALRGYDANHAWIRTTTAQYTTSDGGATWQVLSSPNGGIFPGSSPSELWLMANDGSSLQRSTDGGVSWSARTLPPTDVGFTHFLSYLRSTDASHALLSRLDWDGASTYRETLWVTSDAAASWQQIPLQAGDTCDAFVDCRLFSDGSVVVASGGAAPMRRTTDRGVTWLDVPVPPGTSRFAVLSGLRFTASTIDTTWLSMDGGATWELRSAGQPLMSEHVGIWMFDAREGLVSDFYGSLLRTQDGGRHWDAVASPTGRHLNQLQFQPGTNRGWALNRLGSGEVVVTNDRGNTWSSAAGAMSNVMDFHFIDAQRGWAVSTSALAVPTLWRSVDGGVSWQDSSPPGLPAGLRSIRFIDSTNGVAVGITGLVATTSDGGASWTPRSTGVAVDLFRVAYADRSTLVAVGMNVVIRSTDGGASWQQVTAPVTNSLTDVRFFSATGGHVVGLDGQILATSDAGVTWQVQQAPTLQPLMGVFFLDANTGWVVGDGGLVLVTLTGGR